MATLAPSRRKAREISLPIPLRRRFLRRITELPSTEIIVGDLAEAEGQVGDDVDARENLEDGQLGHGGQRVRTEIKRRRPRPRAFDRNVVEVVLRSPALHWQAQSSRSYC